MTSHVRIAPETTLLARKSTALGRETQLARGGWFGCAASAGAGGYPGADLAGGLPAGGRCTASGNGSAAVAPGCVRRVCTVAAGQEPALRAAAALPDRSTNDQPGSSFRRHAEGCGPSCPGNRRHHRGLYRAVLSHPSEAVRRGAVRRRRAGLPQGGSQAAKP